MKKLDVAAAHATDRLHLTIYYVEKSSRVGTNNDICLQTNYHSSIDGNNYGSDDFY